MIGVVEIYKGDKKILEEPNMTMDNLGSTIAFWMSLPRGFSGIPEAASLYDTSNYTVKAASLAKDARGYSYHAHSSRFFLAVSGDGKFRVLTKDTGEDAFSYKIETGFATYVVSSDGTYTDANDDNLVQEVFYKIDTFNPVLPEASTPTMTRLESKSTKPAQYLTDSTVPDVGHNLNFVDQVHPSKLNYYKLAGCYAPSAGGNFMLLSSLPTGAVGTVIDEFVPNLAGFNSTPGRTASAIDKKGFIKVTVPNVAEGNLARNNSQYFKGLLLCDTGSFSTDLEVQHVLGITLPDFLCLNFFGGIYTIGLWGYDVEKMLKDGKYPPFSKYTDDEIDYRLIARKTFNRDLTYYESSIKSFSEIAPLIINWKFKFK